MKKMILYTVVFFVINSDSGAQVIDSGYLKVTYNLIYLIDSTKPDIKKKDVFHLIVGDKVSQFYSYNKFRSDSIVNIHILNGTMEEFVKNSAERNKFDQPGLYSNYTLFMNYPETKLTVIDYIIDKKFIYEEQLEEINWRILPETLSVQGYLCQKATVRFRSRNYVAWFTQEVPINEGPYKFKGLPGLIVKLSDTNNNYEFECTGIEYLKHKKAITIQNGNCIRTNREEFRNGFKATFDNPWESLLASGITIGGKDGESAKSILQRRIPYNPIELE